MEYPSENLAGCREHLKSCFGYATLGSQQAFGTSGELEFRSA